MSYVAIAGAVIATPAAAWVQDRGQEWPGGISPLWWMLGAWGIGVVILVLILWALVNIAPIILAIIAAVLGIRWLMRATDRLQSGDAAVATLRERYARGEISKEEFDSRLRDLRQR